MNSNSVTIPSSSQVAIDTGTTLVGGPAEQISQLFAQIPGSAPATGNYEGYYTYRKLSFYLRLSLELTFHSLLDDR